MPWKNKITGLSCAVFLVALLVLGWGAAGVFGQDHEEEWEEVERTREEIEELEQKIINLEAGVRQEEEKMQQIAVELEEVEERLEEAKKELEIAQKNLEEVRGRLGSRMRSTYVSGGFSYLEILFGAESMGDLILRTEYLSRVFQQDRELISRVRQVREHEQQRRQEVEEDYKIAEKLYQEHKESKQRLEERRVEKEEMLYAAKDDLKEQLARISTRAEAPPVYGMVIDNSLRARPQDGLSEAQLVYEYEVEASLTRYLALFSEFPSRVGPLRSARVHSAMLAMENEVLMVYAGAHESVQARLDQMGVNHVNTLFSNGSVYRDTSRSAPHNLYVNLSTLGRVPPPDRSEIKPVHPRKEGSPGEEISYSYNHFTNVSYRYDPVDGVYQRYLNGEIHRDAGGDRIKPRNVILQHVTYHRDGHGRPTANLVGEGKIDFYSNGRHFQGTWEKSSEGAPTRFYYQDGTEIEIPYGQTWIQLVRAR